MKLKFIKIPENPKEGGFSISLPENSQVYGLRSDMIGAFLICEVDESSKSTKNHLFVWLREDDEIKDPKHYKFIGHRGGDNSALFEVIGIL